MTSRQEAVIDFKIDNTPSSETTPDVNDPLTIDLDALISLASEEGLNTPGNKAVKKAGRKLRKKEGDLKQAKSIIQAFRAAHEKPLDAVANIVERFSRKFTQAKPFKRLKRLDTIIDKLQRNSLDGTTANQTCISNMADIGGCRLIVDNLNTLSSVRAGLEKTKHQRLCVKKINDYINKPKSGDCGYRCLHLIYQYQHSQGKSFKIEVQLRTELQHIWATTVEIIDTLEQTNIKTHSHAPQDTKPSRQILWEELLTIMSRYIADKEGVVLLSKESKAHDATRLNWLNQKINAIARLDSFRMISEQSSHQEDTKGHVLFVFNNSKEREIIQHVFTEHSLAISAVNTAELIYGTNSGFNILLVSTKALSSLSAAYPNYIGDCQRFIELLNDAMELNQN